VSGTGPRTASAGAGDWSLAVDFGTSSSSAAVVRPGAEPRLIAEPGEPKLAWPSAVFADGDRLLTGSRAEALKAQDPLRFRDEFKRNIGQAEPIRLGDRSCSPRELVEAVIADLKEAAEEVVGAPVTRTVLTIPASYTHRPHHRALMIEAARGAGLDTVDLLPEPVAAAFASLPGRPLAAGDRVLIYDLGGGTFDTAVIQVGSRYAVLGHDSASCGGSDLDAELIRKLSAHNKDWHAAQLDALSPGDPGRAERLYRVRLGELAREMKHELTESPTAARSIAGAPAMRMSANDLRSLAGDLLGETVDCCQNLLARLKLNVADIAAVILVGGSTRMPMVAAYLKAKLGLPDGVLRTAVQPDLAVVQGAARWAAANPIPTLISARHRPGTVLLRWDLPAARLTRWLVSPGQKYDAGTPLARTRLADGTMWELRASAPGRFVQEFLGENQDIAKDQWIALAQTS